MPVPTSITQLNVNEALNSPLGTENVGSPGSVDNYFRAIQAILRTESLMKSWEVRGDVVSYISATSFSVPGDNTASYSVNRRVQANGATTIYGNILSSSYGGVITTVTILPDSGALDPTLSSVYLGTDPLAAVADPPVVTGEVYFDAGNSGAALAINWNNGTHQQFTLTGNATITLGAGIGIGWHTLRIVQDATGGRTIAWAGAAYADTRWIGDAAAPAMNGAVNSVCFVRLFWDGSTWSQKYVGSLATEDDTEVYYNAGNSAAALSINWSNGRHQQFALTANAAITLGAGVHAGWHTLRIVQDATGGRAITWSGSGYSASRWLGNGVAPFMDRVAGSVSYVRLFWDGSIWTQKYFGSAARRANYDSRVSRSGSDQVVTGGAAVATIIFNNVISDPYGEWNVATGVFTAKVAGLYQLTAAIQLNITTGGFTMILQPVIGGGGQSSFTYIAGNVSGHIVQYNLAFTRPMAAGETAFVQISTGAGMVLSVGLSSECQVTRLGDAQ